MASYGIVTLSPCVSSRTPVLKPSSSAFMPSAASDANQNAASCELAEALFRSVDPIYQTRQLARKNVARELALPCPGSCFLQFVMDAARNHLAGELSCRRVFRVCLTYRRRARQGTGGAHRCRGAALSLPPTGRVSLAPLDVETARRPRLAVDPDDRCLGSERCWVC